MDLRPILLLFIVCGICGCDHDDYMTIPGTRLSIAAPDGFKPSENFTGLEKDDQTGIQIKDLVGADFHAGERTFTKESFEEKDLEVIAFEELTIDGFKAKFAHLKGLENNETMAVIFGDDSFTVSAMAIFPTGSDQAMRSALKKSLQTIKYDKNRKVDLLADAYFEILPNASKFKFAKATGNMFVFSPGGALKSSYENEPMVTIVPLPFDQTMTKQDLFETVVEGLIDNGFTVEDVRNTTEDPINGYNAISSRYYFRQGSSHKLAYLALLAKGKRAIAFYGIAKEDWNGNMAEFEKLLKSVRFK